MHRWERHKLLDRTAVFGISGVDAEEHCQRADRDQQDEKDDASHTSMIGIGYH